MCLPEFTDKFSPFAVVCDLICCLSSSERRLGKEEPNGAVECGDQNDEGICSLQLLHIVKEIAFF
jgi:hypothetical protein